MTPGHALTIAIAFYVMGELTILLALSFCKGAKALPRHSTPRKQIWSAKQRASFRQAFIDTKEAAQP